MRRALAVAGVVAALAVGAGVRLYGLDREPVWSDETLSARAARLSVAEILTEAPKWEHNPPLYAVALHAWVAVAGDAAAPLRFPSAVLGVMAIGALAVLARDLAGRRVAAVTLALAVLWPILVQYSQEARAYGLLVLLATVSWMLFVRSILGPGRLADAIAYSATTALLLYTHNQALFVVGAQVVAASCIAVRRRRWPLRWAAALGFALAAWLPWLPTLVAQARQIADWKVWWLPPPVPKHVLWLGYHASSFVADYPFDATSLTWLPGLGGAAWGIVATSVLVGALAVLGSFGRSGPHESFDVNAILLAWLTVPVAGAYGVSHLATPMFLPRFQLAVVPALVVLAARGIVAAGRSNRGIAAITIVVIAGHGLALARYHRTPLKEQWNAVAAVLTRDGRPGDVVVLSSQFIETPFAYHYRGSLPRVAVNDFEDPFLTARALAPITAHHRRLWLVEAHSGRNVAVGALRMLVPRGPVMEKSVIGVRLALYDLERG